MQYRNHYNKNIAQKTTKTKQAHTYTHTHTHTHTHKTKTKHNNKTTTVSKKLGVLRPVNHYGYIRANNNNRKKWKEQNKTKKRRKIFKMKEGHKINKQAQNVSPSMQGPPPPPMQPPPPHPQIKPNKKHHNNWSAETIMRKVYLSSNVGFIQEFSCSLKVALENKRHPSWNVLNMQTYTPKAHTSVCVCLF